MSFKSCPPKRCAQDVILRNFWQLNLCKQEAPSEALLIAVRHIPCASLKHFIRSMRSATPINNLAIAKTHDRHTVVRLCSTKNCHHHRMFTCLRTPAAHATPGYWRPNRHPRRSTRLCALRLSPSSRHAPRILAQANSSSARSAACVHPQAPVPQDANGTSFSRLLALG